MWYFVEILFAQPPSRGRKMFMCETSEVLFRGDSAEEVYRKAVAWAKDNENKGLWKRRFVGITRLFCTDEDQIVDGTELAGTVFQKKDVWKKPRKIVPKRESLNAFIFEREKDTPVGELLEKHRGKSFADRINKLDQ